MKKINTSDDLFSFLDFLRENDELERQEAMANKIKTSKKPKIKIKEEEEEETEKEDEKDKENEEKEEEKEEEKKDEKDKGLPGAKTLAELPSTPPDSVQAKDLITRLKFIRAGASLTDPKVQKSISEYLASLSPDESQNLWIYLDAIARIALIGADAAEVESPETGKTLQSEPQEKPVGKKTAKEKIEIKTNLPIVSPVIVGESVKKLPREVDVPLRNGKLVPYGSKKHIEDLEARIEDLVRIRSYQSQGSDSRYTLSQAINSLKSQLRSVSRTYQRSQPTVQEDE